MSDDSNPAAASLAATPPMGWNSWNAYRTRIDEGLILANAEALVARGLRDAGYTYVVIDDGWQAPERQADGHLQADPERFPHGMGWLVEQIHAMGLRAGLYASPGCQTCAMLYDEYPGTGLGSAGREERDITQFAAWGVDYLKYDWCEAERSGLHWREATFEKMAGLIAATGRDMVYSISEYGQHQPWLWAPRFANSWRTTPDIAADFASVVSILRAQRGLEVHAGPGHWNDPDMLQVGNPGLDEREGRSHFGLWCLLAAPLMAGNELFSMTDQTAEVLSHRGAISVNQDPLGRQAGHVLASDAVEVLCKPLSGGRLAWGVLNVTDREVVHVTLEADEVRLRTGRAEHRLDEAGTRAVDVWSGIARDSWTLAPHELAFFTTTQAHQPLGGSS